jgi:hypothetical protein
MPSGTLANRERMVKAFPFFDAVRCIPAVSLPDPTAALNTGICRSVWQWSNPNYRPQQSSPGSGNSTVVNQSRNR